jgi:XTP/dITP diphosphohydrolase
MSAAAQPLLIATRNAHKTAEIRAILGPRFAVSDLTNRPDLPEVAETGTTFLANATLKAVAISRLVDGLVLADDSGLEVDALAGAPGVHSARYAGGQGDTAANNAKLVAELTRLALTEPATARFRCVIVLARGGEVLGEFAGSVEGCVTPTASGAGGFGYDPLFVPAGHQLSFAELPAEVKNSLSHRGHALAMAAAWLANHL